MSKLEALEVWGTPLEEEDIGSGRDGAILRIRYQHEQYLYFEGGRLVGVMQNGIVRREATRADQALKKEADKASDSVVKRFSREDTARRKLEGVKVGMSEADVVQSSWGKPQQVHRTTTGRGVREQWVYRRGYLYFEDGVLVTIQD